MGYSHHGGGCCGVFHVHDLPTRFAKNSSPKKWLNEAVTAGRNNQYSRYYDAPCTCSSCDDDRDFTDKEDAVYAVDIILADYPMDTWEEVLLAAGFKMVLSFNNTNSGNDCYIFVGVTSELKL